MSHRQLPDIDLMGWLIILGGVAVGWVIWKIDQWRLEAGYRVEPAPPHRASEPTAIVQKAEGQQAGEPK